MSRIGFEDPEAARAAVRRRAFGIGILPSMTVGLGRDDDEFDGRVLVIQWGRFAFEIFIGRRA